MGKGLIRAEAGFGKDYDDAVLGTWVFWNGMWPTAQKGALIHGKIWRVVVAG